MPFPPAPRPSFVLASVLAAAGMVLAAAACSQITPLAAPAAPAAPVSRLGSPIILQVLHSQPPTGTGSCPAGLVQVCATMPSNYIAFEYPVARPDWWYDIIEGLPHPIVEDGHIRVWDAPGLGVRFNVEAARQYLLPEDSDFFD